MSRLHDETGQASIELLGMLPLLLMAAMLMWQLHLVASTSNATANAARTGSRVAGLGGDGRRAALLSLPKSTRDSAQIRVTGERVTVKVEVPIIVPTVHTGAFSVSDHAELPATQ